MSIPDEKARAWTRPEDYWPPRRRIRSKRSAIGLRREEAEGEPLGAPRLLLTTIPYVVLMVGLAVLTIAIMFAAWPGKRPAAQPVQRSSAVAEVGTAPKGWLAER